MSKKVKDAGSSAVKKESSIKNFIDSLVIAFVMAMIIRAFLFSTYKIPSGSMLETLQIGDFIVGNKFAYIFNKPSFGDVAIFEYPLEPGINFVKRVIGVPGDRIEIRNKVVYRNGSPLEESYKVVSSNFDLSADFVNEFTVPDGYYFMVGDNRDHSFDSRFWGFVPEDSFRAKAMFVYFSIDPSAGLPLGVRWGRLLKWIR